MPALLPLVGELGIAGVTLSGAGPGVLVVVASEEKLPEAAEAIRRQALKSQPEPELVVCRFVANGAESSLESGPGMDR